MIGNVANLDLDGNVNLIDFAILADQWMIELEYIEDLTGNKVLGFADLKLFVDYWLWQSN